ncbi:hypothetical protein BH11ACT5_BH11ACT5_27950 [soil metagenome]
MTPANPFRSALKAIGIVGLVLGALLLLIGAGVFNAAVTNVQLYGGTLDATSWAVLVGAGSWAGGIGAAALLLWLVVSSIGWDAALEPPARTTLTPEEITEHLARKAERG